MQNFFGYETFVHFADAKTSAYLMVNKRNGDVGDLVYEMQKKSSDPIFLIYSSYKCSADGHVRMRWGCN